MGKLTCNGLGHQPPNQSTPKNTRNSNSHAIQRYAHRSSPVITVTRDRFSVFDLIAGASASHVALAEVSALGDAGAHHLGFGPAQFGALVGQARRGTDVKRLETSQSVARLQAKMPVVMQVALVI